MAEKYLGEKGLAKLIELVKENSGGSPTYIMLRNTPKKTLEITLTNNTLHSFMVDVKNPLARPKILVQVWFNGNASYTTFSHTCTFTDNALWITEANAIARETEVEFYARLYYIGPDENKINSKDFTIVDVQKLE